MSQQSVPFHLSEAYSALHVPPAQRLIGDFISRSRSPHLELIGNHVAQTLVVNHPDEDVRLELQAAQTRVEALGAVVIVPGGLQHLAEVLERRILLGESEWRGVVAQAVEGAGLSGHALDEHTDGHSGRESVRVEQDVRGHAALGEGHVLRGPQATQDTLLTVSAGEFVSDGGVPGNAVRDAHAFEAACAGVIAAHFDIVHHAIFLAPGEKQELQFLFIYRF